MEHSWNCQSLKYTDSAPLPTHRRAILTNKGEQELAERHPIDRYQVYTRDEAAELMRMTSMEMDDLLEASGAQIVDTGRRRVYLGEMLLRVLGADFSTCPTVVPPPREISAQVTYPADEAARLLNVSVRTLRRLAHNGQIKPARVRGRVVYQGQELLRFLEQR